MSQCHCQADNSVTVPLPSRQQCYTATAMQTTSHCHGQADNSVTVPLPSRQQCHSATAKLTTVSLPSWQQCHSATAKQTTVVFAQLCYWSVSHFSPMVLKWLNQNLLHCIKITVSALCIWHWSVEPSGKPCCIPPALPIISGYKTGTVCECVHLTAEMEDTSHLIWNRHSLVCVHLTAETEDTRCDMKQA